MRDDALYEKKLFERVYAVLEATLEATPSRVHEDLVELLRELTYDARARDAVARWVRRSDARSEREDLE